MVDVRTLEGVLDKTRYVLADVRPEMYDMSTPCPDYSVRTLVDHIVGWMVLFAASVQGHEPAGDPDEFTAGDHPEEQFAQGAQQVLEALGAAEDDQAIKLVFGEMPARAVANLMTTEYIGHGWDLAVATGQRPPFNETEAKVALADAKLMLKPEFQGPGKSFGMPVPVPADAPALDQLIGFLGRDPKRAYEL